MKNRPVLRGGFFIHSSTCGFFDRMERTIATMLLEKKQFFAFIISFVATFSAGFFAYDIFINSGYVFKYMAGYANGIDPIFFTASVAQNNISDSQFLSDNLDDNISESEEDFDQVGENLVVMDQQNLLDDIAEKIDVIERQVAELTNSEPLPGVLLSEILQDENLEDQDGQIKEDDQGLESDEVVLENEVVLDQEDSQDYLPETSPSIQTSAKEGGSTKPVYSKILISEVQIAPIADRFVELYNPNNYEISLTDWYIQRKTETSDSWNSFVSSTKFEGKIISANGYFLISRSDDNADVLLNLTITENNSLILKNPNGEVVDKLGFGLAQNCELLPAENPEENKSIGRKIFDLEEQDTDNNSEDFEIQTPTPRSENITWTEPANFPTPIVLPPEEEDLLPPTVNFSLNALQNSLIFGIEFTMDDLTGAVTSSGIDSYIFRWHQGGDDWHEDPEVKIDGAPHIATGTRDFTGEDKITYYFQIKTKDAAGNESDWLPETPTFTEICILKNIIINEIQTEGQTSKDEFIELYNPNDSDIDLSNFSLKKKTSSGNESNLVSSDNFLGIIPGLGYFLIAPQDNEDGTSNYTGTVTPDLYYSGKTYSIASNNTVLLYDKDSNLLDKVGFGSAIDFEGAPAPNPDNNKGITRTDGADTDNNSQDFVVSDSTPQASR